MTTDIDNTVVRVGPPQIQTAEDARIAYLREEIDLEELEKILGKFGQSLESTSMVFGHGRAVQRIDDAFRRTLPEEAVLAAPTVDYLIKADEAKRKEREEATKNSAPTFKTSLVSEAPIKAGPETSGSTQTEAEKIEASNKAGQEQAKALEERREAALKLAEEQQKLSDKFREKADSQDKAAKPASTTK